MLPAVQFSNAAAEPAGVSARVLAGLPELLALAEPWERLLERAGGSVFQTPAWLAAWWEAFGAGQRMLAIVAYRGGRLVGAAPLAVADGTLRFIGSANRAADYCDFAVDPEHPEALDSLLACACEAAGPLRRIELAQLPAHSPNRERLLQCVAARGWRLRWRVEQLAPARRLVDAAADRRAANKQSLRRHARRLRESGELRFERPAEAEAMLPYLDRFFEQHVARWAQAGVASQFHDARQRDFFRALARRLAPRGWLRFDVMLFDGEPAAFHFGFEYGGKFYWYKPAFDVRLAARSPGEVLIQRLLTDAIDRRLLEFDFTVGAEPFKFRFSNVVREVGCATAYASAADYWRDGAIGAARSAWRRLRRRDPRTGAPRALTSAAGAPGSP